MSLKTRTRNGCRTPRGPMQIDRPAPVAPYSWSRRMQRGRFFRTRTLCPIFPPFGPADSHCFSAQTLSLGKRDIMCSCAEEAASQSGPARGGNRGGSPSSTFAAALSFSQTPYRTSRYLLRAKLNLCRIAELKLWDFRNCTTLLRIKLAITVVYIFLFQAPKVSIYGV